MPERQTTTKSDRQARLQETLEHLLVADGILGTAIISRDGIPVLSRFAPSFDQVAFSILVQGAMVATLMGAAEVAITESEGGATKRVIVESERMRMIVLGATEGLLLACITGEGVPLEKLLPAIEGSAETIRGILEGG